jgi:uncharacterized protein DUF559
VERTGEPPDGRTPPSATYHGFRMHKQGQTGRQTVRNSCNVGGTGHPDGVTTPHMPDARSESVLESVSRVAFRDQGLPSPELQVWVGDETEMIGRADFLWTAHRTIAEADGAIKYADPSRAMAQLERDARLRKAGFELVHLTWQEITRTPEQVAASIRAAFQRATMLSTANKRLFTDSSRTNRDKAPAGP